MLCECATAPTATFCFLCLFVSFHLHGSGCSPLHESSSLSSSLIFASRSWDNCKAAKHHSRLRLKNNYFAIEMDQFNCLFLLLVSQIHSWALFFSIYCLLFLCITKGNLSQLPVHLLIASRLFFSLFPLYVLLLVTSHRRVLRCVSEHALLLFLFFPSF